MANALIVNQLIDASLTDYTNSLVFPKLCKPFTMFDDNSYIGETVTETYPIRYAPVPRLDVTDTDINSTIVKTMDITVGAPAIFPPQYATLADPLNTGYQTLPFGFSMVEASFYARADTRAQFNKLYSSSGVKAIGVNINSYCLSKAYENWTQVFGDPSQNLAALLSADGNSNGGNSAVSQMNRAFASMEIKDKRDFENYAILSCDGYSDIGVPYAQVYNERINYPILDSGTFGIQAGITFVMDSTIRTVINGTFDAPGNVTVVGNVPQSGVNDYSVNITLAGFTPSSTGVLLKGNYIYFGAPGNYVNFVSPLSRRETIYPKTFLVLSDVDSDGVGNAVVTVREVPIFNEGSVQNQSLYYNMSRQILNNDIVNLFGAPNAQWVANIIGCREGAYYANPQLRFTSEMAPSSGKNNGILMGEMAKTVRVKSTPDLTIAMNLSWEGTPKTPGTTYYLRTAVACTPFENYGGVYASSR